LHLVSCSLITIFTSQFKALLKEIVIAVQSWGEAHSFIQKHKLFRWIIIPGIIYTILFIAGMLFFWHSSDTVVSWVSQKFGIETWLQKTRSEWLSFLFVMMGMMLRLIMVLFYFSLFKYLILIIGSPVFAYLSEKTEAIIEGKEHTLNWPDLKRDARRGIKLACRNAGWQSVYLLALIFLSLVPLVGWITPVIALLMECYYFGYCMLDYSFARNNFSPAQSAAFSGRHKGLAIGNGLLFYLMHIVIFLAPAYAVIAATLCVHKVKTS
jgi:CysZ protein